MTDEQIIKALECCCLGGMSCPNNCPLYDYEGNCWYQLKRPLLDLINRQKAEIERLEQENFDRSLTVETWKVEAVKEFAERLKDKITMSPHSFISIDKWYIDNLVKEMAGEG